MPSFIIGGSAVWFIFDCVKESRIKSVGLIAQSRYETLKQQLNSDKHDVEELLVVLVSTCRQSDFGVNACSASKLQQFLTINQAIGIRFHSAVEPDLLLGSDPAPNAHLLQTVSPTQIAITSKSTKTGQALYSIQVSDAASGFSLVVTYSGQKLQDIFVNSPELGKSGETFLADNQGMFFTNARYDSEQGRTQPISAPPMRACLSHENAQMLDVGYHNQAIIHGFRYVPEIGGGCIMAHIDQAEAFAPLFHLTSAFVIGVIIAVGIAWLVAKKMSTNIIRPVTALAEMAKSLRKGDFSRQASESRYQEISHLARLFNAMAFELQIYVEELHQAKIQAEKANQAKSDFLTSMSHELFTPMNAILGFAQILKYEDLSEEQHFFVESILTGSHHLLDLIREVLDFSLIESKALQLNLQPLDLCQIIKICINLTQGLAVSHQNQLIDNTNITDAVTVCVDALRLKQVLLNLISNAIKYTQPGGNITLTCEYPAADKVRISVIDTGVGLSNEDITKLFQPFERFHAKNSAIEGAGLGLCISKKLIEAMNGSIGVVGNPEKGCCSWIELPISPVPCASRLAD